MTKILGLVRAIHVGVNPPINQLMVWFDDTEKIHKVYNSELSVWIPLGTILSKPAPLNTADSTGYLGEIRMDDSFLYLKTSEGWKRTALSTF
jgi:hypothetical protein